MRSLHFLIKLFVVTLLVTGAVLVTLFPVPDLFRQFEELKVNVPYRTEVRQIGGGVLAFCFLLAFLPLWRGSRKGKTISFQGTHGDVTIELEPVESTMERVVGKLPEVKNCAIRLKPNKERTGVQAFATAVLLKDANADARQITARVNSYILAHTRKILGIQDVTVNLKVNRFVVNMKTVRPEPLMLEGPQDDGLEPQPTMQSPVAAAAAVAAASQPPAAPAPNPVAQEHLSSAARAMEAFEEPETGHDGDVDESDEFDVYEEEDALPEAVVEDDDENGDDVSNRPTYG